MLRHRLTLSTVICALPFALVACGEKAQTDPRTSTPLVRAAIVQGFSPESRSFSGTIAARVQSDLGFRVSGKVLARLVDAGQTVKRGQPLLRIDPADLKLAAQAQLEAVAAARARAQQTAQDEARYRDLRGTGAISASAYDQVKAAADAAKAQLSAAEAQADVARNASRYAELVADGDGVVMETLAEPGQVVGAGQIVVRLAHAGRREAVIQLPETLRPAVGSSGQATLFGKEDVRVPARLRQLSDAADRLTRTFEARYVLEGELADAPLGATVTIRIPDGQAAVNGGMQVPIGALFDAGKGPGVWLIDGKPAKVSWRPVTVLQLGDDSARIAGQIKQGDRIVALGAHLLREGGQVRVAEQAVAMASEGVQP
ncbi:efflux RND transporter periplasmic adaptor subunit [Vogesella indigofera]|uniref:Efflux RND transporter periplasmic adaptor subunit n=1 Tax=Vogesella indigofera TaxID=45465 RepID=A0ABT5I3G4_VOGIN|nr:efflux RND transporter periplasmic adaptor subunit [Vogesella indigofera]MDC7690723.1 efflux RND transporter periplasmic adaptor subunit [Vogesella indigofera]